MLSCLQQELPNVKHQDAEEEEVECRLGDGLDAEAGPARAHDVRPRVLYLGSGPCFPVMEFRHL